MASTLALTVAIFVTLLAGMELGRWLRLRRADADAIESEHASADGAVFALLGLIIAFTFSSAASRFDELSRLIVSQANTVGTLWSRIDLLAEPDRQPMRRYLREWVKDSIEVMPVSAEMEAAAFGNAICERAATPKRRLALCRRRARPCLQSAGDPIGPLPLE